MSEIQDIKRELQQMASPEKAKILQRFFKTGKGEYGEGDRFIGVKMPEIHSLVKAVGIAQITTIEALLHSPIHEERMTALLLLLNRMNKARKAKDEAEQERIINFYLANHTYINNWDLVDLSAPKILGKYLYNKNQDILIDLAQHGTLWQQRIGIISCLSLIQAKDFSTAITISEILLHHSHDLIQKAVGWMLREIGKRDQDIEEAFLQHNGRYKTMPRTMLRYAIEKFPNSIRQQYLKGEL